MSVLYDAAAEARLRVLPLIENMRTHWKRHERMFLYVRDRKPKLARKAVLEDILYAERLLRSEAEIQQKKQGKPTQAPAGLKRSSRAATARAGK